jgi:outer membrane protein OmpA-like peptidoglycan-associated protein
MKLVGRGDDADPLGLTEKQALILQSDQPASGKRQATVPKRVNPVAQAAGAGFKAKSPVKFYLLPSTYVGQLGTDESGAFSGTIPVPPGITPGAYTLQMNGYSPTDSVRSLSIAVIVKPTTRPMMKARARVTFDPLDASLDAEDRKVLKAIVRKAGQLGVRSIVLGFVQPTSVTSNDLSLSTQRAKNVAAFLRARGLKGTYVISGKGRAVERTAIARRVVVTVSYEAP